MEPISRFQLQRQPNEALRSVFGEECQQCGVCCSVYSGRPFGIAVDPMTVAPRKLVQIGPAKRDCYPIGTTQYIRIKPLKLKGWKGLNACAALHGTLRVNVSCSIYQGRPTCCQRFDPGSPACIASRDWASMEQPEDIYCLGRS
jgi:Fe-S-cluster containining protein